MAADEPPQLAVVLTRTVPNAASTDVYRQMLTADGVRVLGPTVGRLERYAQAFGLPITSAALVLPSAMSTVTAQPATIDAATVERTVAVSRSVERAELVTPVTH